MPETAGKGTTIFFCEITHGNLPFDLVWHGSKISWSLSILIIVWSFQSRCSRRLQNCPRITIKFLAFFFYSTVTLSSWVWKASCSLNKPMKHRKTNIDGMSMKVLFWTFRTRMWIWLFTEVKLPGQRTQLPTVCQQNCCRNYNATKLWLKWRLLCFYDRSSLGTNTQIRAN